MSTEEQRLADAIRRDHPGDPAPPPFEATFLAAEERLARTRRRRTAVAAAALVLAAGFAALYPTPTPDGIDSPLAEALMTSTSWTAPSDILLPRHEIDLYGELPSMELSTETEDGALL